MEVHVHLHLHGIGEIIDAFRAEWRSIHAILERLEQMSQTLSQQLDAATAAITGALDQISADVGTVAADIKTLVDELQAGNTVTQTQVDSLNALATRAAQIDDALKAAIATVPTTPPNP